MSLIQGRFCRPCPANSVKLMCFPLVRTGELTMHFSKINRQSDRHWRLLSLLLFAATLLAFTHPLRAAERGFSNYIPGTYGDFGLALAPPKGVYVRNNTFSYSADRKQRVGQGEARVSVDALVDYATMAFVTDRRIFGARLATVVGIPVVDSTVRTRELQGGTTTIAKDTRFAVGDLFVTPVSLLWQAGDFHFNLYEYIVTPSGAFDAPRSANGGFGYWSFQTVFATTYRNPDRKLEASLLFGHAYNLENPETDYQTGQEIFMEYMINRSLSRSVSIGLHGYVYDQITGDSGDGAVFGSFAGEAAGIGPAIAWSPPRQKGDVTFIAKWLHEFHAVNRFKGDFLTASFVLKF